MTTLEIASWLGGEVSGDEHMEIRGVAKIEEARDGDITFLANPKYERFLSSTNASAVLVSHQLEIRKHDRRRNLTFIKVQDPYVAFLKVLRKLVPQVDPFTAGVHPTAVIAKTARIGSNVSIGAHCVVGEEVEIGNNSKISGGCVIGAQARIGRDSLLYAHVTVYHQCRIGNRVTLHSGCVVGSDGFGFAPLPDGAYEKIPQAGIAVIEDDVEIGANTTINRATLGETLIKRGVKIDNLVQIAHNVVIGENTVIAAQTGISGSVKIGRNCMIAGQVGIAGHLEIADRTVILAQSGVAKSILESGKTYFGTPVKDQNRAARIEAVIRSLPELSQDVQKLKQELEALKQEFLKVE
ncbi:MAG TPA: UDP-3-O-(3-hydroxymyristoyl)glucosamine N-acyltransferase [Bacteroidota bacterium]|nr:UDP-3-O-(3-hydroxymyristoyl)glucosamine N-acyltransferase [Bacteroidota bacterium]